MKAASDQPASDRTGTDAGRAAPGKVTRIRHGAKGGRPLTHPERDRLGIGDADRQLVAVVHIDIVGYSRLIGSDDAGTVQRLRTLRSDLIDPQVAAHHGRLVQTAGDSFLLTFRSVTMAARFGVAVQRGLLASERHRMPAQQIRFRIGIEMGDVIAEGSDLHGNGVIVAVRLQSLCPPGGICISAAVHEHVHHRFDVAFAPIGAVQLKNVAYPVTAFVVQLDEAGVAGGTAEPAPAPGAGPGPTGYRHPVAVMRFASAGSGQRDSYFADGIVEDVVTALSRFRSLFVIGASTSFRFRSGVHAVQDVGRELGVRYVADGSVRRAGGRIRTTARLCDAVSGEQLWAARFDDEVADIFALQDRITERIVTAIEPAVLAIEIARATTKSTSSLGAYDLFLQAMSYRGLLSRDALIEHHRLLSAAIALDRSYAPALAYAAGCYSANIDQALDIPWLADRDAGIDLADAALLAGPDDPVALCRAGHARAALTEDFLGTVGYLDRAVELNPSYAEAWIRSSVFRLALDELDTALAHAAQAISLSPHDQYAFLARLVQGTAFLFQGRFPEAIDAARRALAERPRPIWARRIMIAALMETGDPDSARAAAKALMAQEPGFRISSWRSRNSFTRNKRFDIVERSLRRVGIPE
jgi:adenylate cyclase